MSIYRNHNDDQDYQDSWQNRRRILRQRNDPRHIICPTTEEWELLDINHEAYVGLQQHYLTLKSEQ